MFAIESTAEGTVVMRGRLDAASAPRAQEFFDRLTAPGPVDMGQLEYISSAGLGVLLRTHKRLTASGQGLRLIRVNKHIHDIFTYSGFDRLFDIEPADGT